MKRESFRSRLGFLLVSAGCAIGIGNVWRFPYVTGKNGGGYFVLFYILCLLIMGVPVLTMELAVGRASRKSAILAYKTLEKPKSKWHIHGWFCLIGCYLLMMYYTTVSGWMVSYFGRFLTGKFYSGMPAEDASAVFGQLLSDPVEMGILAVAIVIVGFVVCSFGLQKGLERVSKVMMLALLLLILVLAVHSLTLSGAAEGMKFYLLPSMDSIRENGLGTIITAAITPRLTLDASFKSGRSPRTASRSSSISPAAKEPVSSGISSAPPSGTCGAVNSTAEAGIASANINATAKINLLITLVKSPVSVPAWR